MSYYFLKEQVLLGNIEHPSCLTDDLLLIFLTPVCILLCLMYTLTCTHMTAALFYCCFTVSFPLLHGKLQSPRYLFMKFLLLKRRENLKADRDTGREWESGRERGQHCENKSQCWEKGRKRVNERDAHRGLLETDCETDVWQNRLVLLLRYIWFERCQEEADYSRDCSASSLLD